MKKFTLLVFVVFFVVFVSMLRSGVSAFTGGDGSSENPYQITNCVQLQEMKNNLNAHYVLMNDIDCSDTVNWNSGVGFVPIYLFAGTFDGQGHKITDLFIKNPHHAALSYNYVGLFAITMSGAVIKNVGLVDVKIIVQWGGAVGGLVGHNRGTITNSYATGSVTSLDFHGQLFA
jgi:hypothetical protein